MPAAPVAATGATAVAVTPVASTTAANVVPVGQDHLRITPDRLMAPVGCEVVLKAGVCGADGYFRKDRRVEWMVSREGVGEIVDLADRDQFDIFRDWGDTPRKIDNWYAIGATSYRAVTLPSGHVVRDGEAWVTVTSSTEGTSQITAFSPSVPSWQFRRATATIYWVDAQWIFPSSAIVESGRPHVLTTTVLRRTDGAPLSGWFVRYTVAGGGAALGYEGGNSIDVPTDSAGRASVEVSPTGLGSGTSTVTMTILRPAMPGPGGSPQLEVGRGAASITWGDAIAPSIPVTSMPAPPISSAPTTSQPTAEPTPATPSEAPGTRPSAAPSLAAPSTDAAPAGRAQLDVRVTRVGPEEVEVNQFVRFDVTVTNRGDAVARGIVVSDRFDRGLSHPNAQPNSFTVEYKLMPDLAPGQTETVPLTFQVVAVGQHSHLATVTAEGGVSGFDRGTVIGKAPAPVAQPVITADKVGPTRAFIGERAEFTIVLKNTGTVPATNLRVVDKYDAAFMPVSSSMDHQRGVDGSVIWSVPRLEVGQRLAINVSCNCLAQSGSACNNLIVTGDGGINQADQVCVEILPPQPGAGGGAITGPLASSVVVTTNPVTAGRPATILVTVENTTQQVQPQVQLRVAIPPEMTPDSAQIEPRGEFVVIGQEVRFNRRDIQPRQRLEFTIPVNCTQAGQVRIRTRLEGSSLAQAVEAGSNVIEILPPAL